MTKIKKNAVIAYFIYNLSEKIKAVIIKNIKSLLRLMCWMPRGSYVTPSTASVGFEEATTPRLSPHLRGQYQESIVCFVEHFSHTLKRPRGSNCRCAVTVATYNTENAE